MLLILSLNLDFVKEAFDWTDFDAESYYSVFVHFDSDMADLEANFESVSITVMKAEVIIASKSCRYTKGYRSTKVAGCRGYWEIHSMAS